MGWARVLIFGTPLAALGVASVAAWQVLEARRPGPEEVVIMVPGPLPELRPFMPVDEAERQILDLLHEPLLRLGRDGRLVPALAQEWRWYRSVTCWFADEAQAAQAAARLQALSGNAWVAGQLEAAAAKGASVVMRFVRPDDPGAEEALQAIRDLRPLPLAVARLEVPPATRDLVRDFATQHVSQIPRLWFDDDACEMVTTLAVPRLQEQLGEWLRARNQPVVPVRIVGELTGLVEPVLEFHLRPGAKWHDGEPVTSNDVHTTVQWLLQRGGPAAEFLRQVQSVTPVEKDRVRVTYRNHAGSALAGWVGVPMLPARWFATADNISPPVGAGPFRIESPGTAGAVTLVRTSPGLGVRRVKLIPAAAGLPFRAGLATGDFEIVWPTSANAALLRGREDHVFAAAPARNRLFVLWNTRSQALNDSRVRAALALATDREALAAQVPESVGRTVEGWFRPGLWYTPNRPKRQADLEAAERRLAEAGWLRDVSGIAKSPRQALALELLTIAGNPARRQLADALALQWRRVGARVTVMEVSPAEFVSGRLEPGRFDAVILGLDYGIAWDIASFWRSDGDLNFSGVADARLDLLIDALAAEYEPPAVPARAQAAEDRLLELEAFLPLFSDRQELALRRDVFSDSGASAVGARLRDLLLPAPPLGREPLNLKMLIRDE